jgi:hypothetical protein
MGGPTGPPHGQGFPPQQSFPPPPQQKSNVLKWVLIGCGSFIIVGVVVVALLGYFVWNKAKQAGLDPELMRTHPAQAVGKMVVAMNPDVELVSADDDKGTITVRDKKTGKVVTVNLEDAQKGKITFKGEGNDGEVSIEAKGSGDQASIDVKSKEGTATFGTASAADLPSWLPTYPSSTVEANFAAKGKDGVGGTFGFTTSDSIETVTKFYEDNLRQAGFKVTTNTMHQSGALISGSVNAEDNANNRTAYINATANEGKTRVTVVYGSK